MIIKRRTIFDWAAICGLSCIGILFVGLLLMVIFEYIRFGFENPDFSGFYGLQPIFLLVSLVLGACVFLLWIEGWIWTFKAWKDRSIEYNIALLCFLVIGPIFAGYALHYLRKRT